jgi:hypothetical protein
MKSYVVMFISVLITAFVLSMIIRMKEGVTMTDGLLISASIWLGFTATVQLGSVLWEKKSVQLFLLNAGHSLVSYLVMGAILTMWL